MSGYRLLAVLGAAAACAAVAVLVVTRVAALGQGTYDDQRELLSLAREATLDEFEATGSRLVTTAKSLAANRGIAGAFWRYHAAVVDAEEWEDPSARQLRRILKTRIVLAKRVARLTKQSRHLTGVAFVRDGGPVAVSQGLGWLKEGEPVDTRLLDLLKQAQQGKSEAGVFADEKGVRYVAVTPIINKRQIIGSVIAEQQITQIPGPQRTNIQASVFAKKVLKLGSASDVLTDKVTEVGAAPVRIEAKKPIAAVFGLELPFGPLWVSGDYSGVWVSRFNIPGSEKLRGFVETDVSLGFADLASAQLLVIVLAVVLWAFFAVMALLGLRPARDGARVVELIDGYAASLADGNSNAQVPAYAAVGPSFGALVERIRSLAEMRQTSASSSSGAGGAPSLAEIIREHGAEPLDFASIDFDSSLGGDGAVELEQLAFSPIQASAHFHTAGATAAAPVAAAAPTAVATAEAVAVQPPSPPVVAAAGAGEPTSTDSSLGDDEDWDNLGLEPLPDIEQPAESAPPAAPKPQMNETTVMQVSPELLEALKQADPDRASEPSRSDKTGDALTIGAPAVGSNAQPPESTTESEPDPVSQPAPEPDPPVVPAVPAPPVPEGLRDFSPPEPENPHAEADQKLYDEFMALRARCGQSGNVGYEKFVQRLDKTRQKVIAEHQCSGVQFTVYERDGAAVLKASPI